MTLEELLAAPSVENWRELVSIGSQLHRSATRGTITQLAQINWEHYRRLLCEAVSSWPKEIQRECPADWPADFRAQVEHRVAETGTYGHYITKICGDARLQLSDGTQAVWLERRFVGGVVPASVAQRVVQMLWDAVKAPSVTATIRTVKDAATMLSGALRNTGKTGTADLTGGLVLERHVWRCLGCGEAMTPQNQTPHSAGVLHCVARSGNVVCGEFKLATERTEARLEVEVKVGDGKQREAQAVRQNSVSRRGGCYVLAYSVEEAVAAILKYRDQHQR